jgi:hypothetical protein
MARNDVAAVELRGTSCSLTLKEPPAERRTLVGVAASAVPFGP